MLCMTIVVISAHLWKEINGMVTYINYCDYYFYRIKSLFKGKNLPNLS